MLTDFQRMLVVAAHPDDEILGAGATVALRSKLGLETHLLVLGEGIGARFDKNDRPDSAVTTLSDEVKRAAAVVGATSHQLALPDNRFDSLDMLDVIHAIGPICTSLNPDIVVTHHPGDLNIDHRITTNAVMTQFRPLPETGKHAIVAFETLSSTEWNVEANGTVFNPNVFVDVSEVIDLKIRAMSEYLGELREWPHPRSLDGIRALAAVRGMTIGTDAAEAFSVLRYVDKR